MPNEAVVVARHVVFGDPKQPVAMVTVPIGIYADQRAADHACRDARQIQGLFDGVIVMAGKPQMKVGQLLAALGIGSIGVVTYSERVREESLIVAAP